VPHKNSKPRLEKRKVEDLIPYPRQRDYFEDLAEDMLRALAKGMRGGQVPPVEVLPENRAGLPPDTILRGHQRCRTARLDGQAEVPVLVRYDLADASASAIELEFLVDNQNRRHQDTLSKARVALRIYELERKNPQRGLTWSEEDEARDRVGRIIGMGGRNLQRYWRILKTPTVVQEAFRSKQLSLVEASKVAGLLAKDQERIASRIRAGEAPRKVIAEYLQPTSKHHRSQNDAFASFCRNLVRGLDDLDGRVARVFPGLVAQKRAELERARTVIDELLARGEQGRTRRSDEEE
jgi:hypothetical protein